MSQIRDQSGKQFIGQPELERSPPWDLLRTATLVETVFGLGQSALVKPCLRSIVDRQHFAKYHYRETSRLLKAFQRRYLKDGLLWALADEDDRTRLMFERLMVAAGAHVTACVQAIHAIPDILASSVYFGYGMNLSAYALSDRNVNLQRVIGVARKISGCERIVELLFRVSSGPDYEHLSALSNLSKHRTVIRSILNEDQTGARNELHEFHIAAFEKLTESGVKNYPQVSLSDLLKPEFERLSKLVVEIGLELNNSLENLSKNSQVSPLLSP